MSTATDHLAMIRLYREVHPEVDWDTHRVYIGRDRDGNWYVRGHRPVDPEMEAAIARIDSCDAVCSGCDECQWRK